MSPGYGTFRLDTDKQGCPSVALFNNLSHWSGVSFHVRVTDMVHETSPAVKSRLCFCSGSRFSIY